MKAILQHIRVRRLAWLCGALLLGAVIVFAVLRA